MFNSVRVFVVVLTFFVDSSLSQSRSGSFHVRPATLNLQCANVQPTVTSRVHSLSQCMAACLTASNCMGVTYNADNKKSSTCEQFHCVNAAQNCAYYQLVQKDSIFSDCAAIKASGRVQSGVYTVTAGGQSFCVYCDMITDGGGWLVFQRRMDGSVDFYRNWYNYTNGFGDLTGEFWLGNEYLYLLTSLNRSYELRFDMMDFDGVKRFAKYSNFRVASSSTFYRMNYTAMIGGDAGDSFMNHNGMLFTTFDADHDTDSTVNCGEHYHGGYWYCNCHVSNPNGLYLHGTNTQFGFGIVWYTWRDTPGSRGTPGNYTWRGFLYSLQRMEMKIRPTV